MIQLNYRDSKPIYEQIKDGLKRLIITGAIAPDEKMPSVRELASQLAINPNTIAKAIRELEQEGYIYTITGRGSFAADRKDISAGRNDQLLKKFDEIVKELLFLNENKDDLKQRIEALAKGGDDHDSNQ
ncbi:MAG: GntR family transcriptional regulator [Lachnospiraceae bacterium]|nr:GntR family transcriptional regulator [Pseudobutyrivibrio sp.]MEE0105164.1 GntR family transcriptional regulator [Lachnospiraceae bacterium]